MKERCPLTLNLLYNTCPVKQQNKGCNQTLSTVCTTSKENCVSMPRKKGTSYAYVTMLGQCT